MGTRDTLLLGRVSGARKMCEELSQDMSRTASVRRWSRLAAWFLARVHKSLNAEINGV